jgi:nucleotide-binding universal stress UspA family protein
MKSILLFANECGGMTARLGAALDLARSFDAQITCLQVTPLDALVVTDPYRGAYAAEELVETVRQRERAHRAQSEHRLAEAGVEWAWFHETGDPIESMIARAALADLVVLSLPGPDDRAGGGAMSLLSEVALYAGAPILAVPDQCASFDCRGAAVVAWDGSLESSHALRAARTLLAKAAKVHLVTVSDDALGLPASEGADYLACHAVQAELCDWPRQGQRVSDSLLEATRSLRASYIVAGAYGHSRFREAVLGGVTRELIRYCPLPLVLAH